jgi:hypothetical protein
MSNNKQSSVEWFAKESWKLRVELEDEKISMGEYANKYYQLKEQAKAMHNKEVVDFVEDWYCNGPLLGGGVDVAATIEEHYNETFGGNND